MPVPVGIALAHSEKGWTSRKAQKPVKGMNKNICGRYLVETRLKQKIWFTDDRRDIDGVQTQLRLNGIFGLMMAIGISRHTASTEKEAGATSSP